MVKKSFRGDKRLERDCLRGGRYFIRAKRNEKWSFWCTSKKQLSAFRAKQSFGLCDNTDYFTLASPRVRNFARDEKPTCACMIASFFPHQGKTERERESRLMRRRQKIDLRAGKIKVAMKGIFTRTLAAVLRAQNTLSV